MEVGPIYVLYKGPFIYLTVPQLTYRDGILKDECAEK
jgi:hypothetical protein